ncbi:MAG: hypothetical protein MUC62_08130 [Candidatus Thermoplasmatota archaeon]|jgi:RNA binding exosome subunit|nr:hypothetical protein [Candidatus Thermoplasmatota archaeon]
MVSKIGHLTLEAFVQATEEEPKVVKALSTLAGADVSDLVKASRTEGFHKNPLIVLRVELVRERDVRGALNVLLTLDHFRSALLEGADERLDEGNVFHCRFDKQSAYLGAPEPYVKGEAVKFTMKVLTFPFSREAAVEGLKDLAETGSL